VLLVAPGTAMAAPVGKAIEVETIRVGFGDKFKVGTWTPVWVQARVPGAEGFVGTMEVVTDDESGTPTAFSVVARIVAGESTRLTAYTRPGSVSGELAVRFVDSAGVVKASFTFDSLRPNNPLGVIYSDDIAVLGLGKAQGIELLPGLPGLNGGRNLLNGQNTTSAASVVEVLKLTGLDANLLPGKAIGYDALDAIVVDTNDKELMTALNASRGETIKEWVGQGGHLVVAVGSNWQAVKDSAIGSILPATPSGMTTITDLRTIEAFSLATNPLVPETGSGKGQLNIAKLDIAEHRDAKVLCATSNTSIVVRGAYGFGRVTVVALDVDSAPFANWADRGLFWVKALDLHPTSASASGNKNRARLTQHGVSDLSTKLREALEQFEGVKLVPFGWVAFFIFLYILLIGPGDYFFLRKVLKRMELTWITFPTIVILVSGAAYWAAYRIKGTELRVNQIDMVDVDIPSKMVRGSSFVALFSPQNRDYDFAVVPKPLHPDSKPGAVETRASWFGAPEVGPRGMNGGGRGISFGSGGYRYEPIGVPSRLTGVRVPIWSTKAFTARWFAHADGEPIVESDLAPSGIDRLDGTITNRLDVPLKDAVLAFNSQVYYNLGTIAPGATVRVELTQDRKLSGHLRDLQGAYYDPAAPWRSTGASVDRYKLAQAILFHDSDTSGVNILPSRPLHGLDLTGQLLLDRPILVAEVDRPMTDLDLGSVSTAPRTSRTTILRAILPLTNPDAGKK
jgi:hypothetical protein